MTSQSGCFVFLFLLDLYVYIQTKKDLKFSQNYLNTSRTLTGGNWPFIRRFASLEELDNEGDRGFEDQHKVGCSKRFVFLDISLILSLI